MPKYITRPVAVEASRWTPKAGSPNPPEICFGQPGTCDRTSPHLHTTAGDLAISPGDYVVRRGDSVFPMRSDLFEKKYFEALEEDLDDDAIILTGEQAQALRTLLNANIVRR